MEWKAFWCERTDRQRLWLRRYRSGETDPKCPATGWIHQALVRLQDAETRYEEREWGGKMRRVIAYHGVEIPHDDPRWPLACACGEPFVEADEWQVFSDAIYRRVDTGEEWPLRDIPIGALYDAWWLADFSFHTGADGIALMCRTPDGDWSIDSRASNCTLPDDHTHKCWVRHGDPRTEPVTVDKNGVTCSAGAGSIQQQRFHGFLIGGILRDC